MTTQDQLGPARVSRRSTLKGMAAAGGAAWTVPTILSTSAAAAATGGSFPCVSCGPDACLDQTPCGSSGGGNPCSCSPLADGSGTCVCTEDLACASASACGPGFTCPPGFACQNSCCGTPKCFPLCA